MSDRELPALPSAQEMVDAMAAVARGSMCPLCGWDRPHEHSPEEIIIYRNGVKWGRNNGNEPWTGSSREGATQAERLDTSAIGSALRNGENEHHEHRAGQSNPDRTHYQRHSQGDGLSGESEIREALMMEALTAIESLDLEKKPNGSNDFYSGPDRFFIAHRLARNALMAVRSWPEDKPHENGEYQCLCCYCKGFFIGHKRRVVCKLCAAELGRNTAQGDGGGV